MKYADHGFRPLYKNFCIYPMCDAIKEALNEVIKDNASVAEADGVMVYGYVDHAQGNFVEVVALAKSISPKKYSFESAISDEVRVSINIEKLMDVEYDFIGYGASDLAEQFKSKVDVLAQYDNENLVESRKMTFLDEFRNEKSFDDVKVILFKEGMGLEGVWVKIEELDKGKFLGTLMNNPVQDFKITEGMPIAFIVHEDKEGKRNLVAKINERKKYTAEELADGKALKSAIKVFMGNKNQYNLYAVLEILKNSKVVVPYSKSGIELLTTKDGKSFFPVFSDMVETWLLPDNFTKTEMPFMDALEKAEIKKNVVGIAVNGMSDNFIIPRSLFEVIKGIE